MTGIATLMQFLGATLLCAVAGVASHHFLAGGTLVDLWHPAAGVALAILLRGGLRFAWAVLAGVLLEVVLTHGMAPESVALVAVGVSGPLCGAWLLRLRPSFDAKLASLRDYLQLMVRGGVLGSLAGAVVGTAAALSVGAAGVSAAPDLALRCWMGNLLGVALLSPLIMAWWGVKRVWSTQQQALESVMLVGLTGLAGQMVFLDWYTDAQHRSPIGYWMFLFVGWAALRLERRGVTVLLLLIAVQALTGAYAGVGFFAQGALDERLLGVWRYLLALSLTGTAMACYVTGRRKEAMTLRQHTLDLRDRALEKVQEGVMTADRERNLTFVNEAFLRVTGYRREELLGRNGSLLQGEGTRAATIGAMRAAFEARRPFRGEILNYRKDGTPFWSDLSITPIFDEQGTLLEYFGVQRDITADKEAALEIRRSAEQLKLALKGSNDGLWDLNLVSDMAQRSESWYQMLGYDAASAGIPHARSQWSDIVHPEDRERAFRELDDALRSGRDRLAIEYRVRHHDGHYLSVLTRGYILRDERGKAVRISGTTTNLTEQKAREARLNLSSAVFRQSREGIVMTDPERRIVMVNTAFARMTGYEEAELVGTRPRLFSEDRANRESFNEIARALEASNHWWGEVRAHRKAGGTFPVWLAISALRDEQGQITHYLGNFSDLSDAREAESRIQWLSHFDAVTGLPNRELLRDRAEDAFKEVRGIDQPVTMLLVGVDRLEDVVITLGHRSADALLAELARRITGSMRAQDTAARVGGEAFALLLPGMSADDASRLADELRRALAAPCVIGEHERSVTASIGVASYPAHGGDFDTLFKVVEIAMHRAQSGGGDATQRFTADMYEQVIAHDRMTRALHGAVALDQLRVLYQPVVDLDTGQVSGMEALLRWNHPELGAVPPDQFIPLAEEIGLINDIGDWVLRRACRDIRAWIDKGIEVPQVAVNVSSLQLRDYGLVEQVKCALADSRLTAGLIQLEVTESALIDDVDRCKDILDALKAVGVGLSLDDFGTGYSSLGYLRRLPFDKVKIDRSFVRDIGANTTDTALVKVIVSMAHHLGLKVVAEGVETEAQCAIMRDHRCNEIQGYLFARPMPAEAIEALLVEGRRLPPHLVRSREPEFPLLLV